MIILVEGEAASLLSVDAKVIKVVFLCTKKTFSSNK